MDIFVDWGSTNFRAFLVRDGKIVDRKRAAGGGTLKGFSGTTPEKRCDAYSAFFVDQLGDWLKRYPMASAYICGAAGGREGWVETKYSIAPASVADVKKNLHKMTPEQQGHAKGRDIYIASGCTITMPDGRHDVMRSEEVKSLGAARHLQLEDGLFCIPGTHGKWVQIAGGAITRFETAMAGEIYNLLSEHGALAALIKAAQTPKNPDFASFDKGFAMAQLGLDLLTDIWQVRSQMLRGNPPPADLAAYFSGLLMGHELRQMEKFFPGRPPVVLLMDSGQKQKFFRHAFAKLDWPVAADVDSETAVCAGLAALK